LSGGGEVKFAIAVMAFLLATGMVSAQELDLQVSPSEAWLGDSVELLCSGLQAGEAWIDIGGRITKQVSLDHVNDTHYSAIYVPPVTGDYQATCRNGTVSSGEIGFSVSDLVAGMSTYPDQAFMDQGIRIEAGVFKSGYGSQQEISSGVGFSVSLDGIDLGISDYYYLSEPEGYWVIETQDIGGLGPGNYNMRLVAGFQGRQAMAEARLDVVVPLEFRIESVSPNEARGGENITVRLVADYHNQSILDSAAISASLNGAVLDIERSGSGFDFICPDLGPGNNELKVDIEYGGFSASDTESLYYMIQVHGEIRNAGNGGVPATLIFTGNDWSESVRTNVNGYFLLNVPSGTYTLEMGFPDSIHARAEGVEILEPLNDFVRFDSYSASEIDGIRVAKVFALEFSHDFERMVVRAAYDGSVVDDESTLMLYTCDDWNIDSRSCNGRWEDLDFDIDAVKNEIEFTLDHLSGFVIGKRSELELEATINRREYASGQTIQLAGVVSDETGRKIDNAKVSYYIQGGSDGYVRTSQNGIYSASIPVPKGGGEYTLEVKVSQGNMKQDSRQLLFSVKSVTDFAVIPPIRLDVQEGASSNAEVVVINNGEEDLENLRVRITGIPLDWLEIEPESWGDLYAGDEKRIGLKIQPESPEQEVYTVDVEVSSDQATRSESFVMYVEGLEQESMEEPIDTNASDQEQVSDFDSVTLYLIGSPEAMINTLSLILSGGIIIFILRRLKSGKARSRDWLLTLLTTINSEVLKTRARARKRRKVNKTRVRKAPEGHLEVEV
jgi:hypothetical protein